MGKNNSATHWATQTVQKHLAMFIDIDLRPNDFTHCN